MHIDSCFDDFWKGEAKLYENYEGVIFCSDKNTTALLPYALVRNATDIECLTFSLQYWQSCCRLAQNLGLSYISMRIADTQELNKLESELMADDWSERICTLTGSSTRAPQNGHFYSTTTKLWIKLSDGVLGLKSGEQDTAGNPLPAE